ncbi:MAG: tRNA uridine-5-carboxymethylaminomethyl(34) synthesis GTPase MnmE, partial [Bacteroidetes bacterium]|nr:tRNA uridine-5-carboxymethylaminomethyl(34) synthesis GTPase MnmE [Bacteroidota bacterium]
MRAKLDGWKDTIVAIATPPGIGAIAIIRISGSNALPIADQLFLSKKISEQSSHTLHLGLITYQGEVIDEVVMSLFKAPRSYTGEDIIEISCHGSPFLQQKILESVIALGARIAKPGEFTLRAFLNGKMDLTQAEAVADLIASNSEAAKNTALKTMRGGFSHQLKEIRETLLAFSSLMELELDFSEEDVEFADRSALLKLLEFAEQTIHELLHSFQLGNVIKNGVLVAIIGKPNAGKSTLLNNLLNENRALVSDIAGTTRDTIEEVIHIGGIAFRIMDTAGLRHSNDTIESMGVEKSYEKLRIADLVIYLFDLTQENKNSIINTIEELKKENPSVLFCGNKMDHFGQGELKNYFSSLPLLMISAKQGQHIEALKEAMQQRILNGEINTENTIITNARHFESLQKAYDSILEIRKSIETNIPGDLIVPDIRNCLFYLGEITGEITHDEQLDFIFSKFC